MWRCLGYLFMIPLTWGFNLTGEQRLVEYFRKRSDPATRPVRSHSTTVVVKFSQTLMRINDLDEKTGVLSYTGWDELEWKADAVSWDPKDFDGISGIAVPSNLFWVPDIVDFTSGEPSSLVGSESRLHVTSSGNILFSVAKVTRSSCSLDLSRFPYDEQICSSKFASWTYHGLAVDVQKRTSLMDLSNYNENSEFELVDVTSKRSIVHYSCCDEPYPDITVTIKIRRRVCVYFMRTILPVLLLSFLSLSVFWIPPDSKEKISLGIGVLLSLFILSVSLDDLMPQNGNSFPLIGVYMIAVKFLVVFSMVLSIAVLNVHNQGTLGSRLPDCIRSLFCLGPKFQRVPQPMQLTESKEFLDPAGCSNIGLQNRNGSEEILRKINQIDSSVKEAEENKKEWMAVASMLDKFFFVFMLILMALTTVIILGILPTL